MEIAGFSLGSEPAACLKEMAVSRARKHHGLSSSRPAGLFGFTLIELMIVVAVVALLAAVALPSYRAQVRKSKRTDAKMSLLDLASREERYSTTNNSYTHAYANLGFASDFPVAVPSATTFNYALAVTAAGTSTFTITATPNGDQVNDTCGTYQLTEQGVQSNTGATTDSATCWR